MTNLRTLQRRSESCLKSVHAKSAFQGAICEAAEQTSGTNNKVHYELSRYEGHLEDTV